MKRILWSAFGLLLMLIFLLGTTGISFYIHECGNSGTKDVFVYPELFGGKADCGCVDEVQQGTAGANEESALSDNACCKNIHLYLKADFRGFTISYHLPVDISRCLITCELQGIAFMDPVSEQTISVFQTDHPPPLRSGIELLTFLHQIKIPVLFS